MRSWILSFVLILGFLIQSKVELKAQPVVIGQPADTSVCNGGNASFYVLAVNTVGFQWQENDGVGWYNIDASITYASGYTTPILEINDANLGLNGYLYRCVVTDGDNNSVTSEAAVLGVNEPPVITMHPNDITVCKNEIAVFSISALYADSYQWQESVGTGWIDITNNAFYSGVTEPNLLIFTTTGMNGFRYRCRMVNGNCPDTTAFARLFVNPTPTLQTVTGGGAFCQGGSGLPIGLADSEAGIAYHMYRNGNSTGIVVSGTGEAMTFGNFTQPGTYTITAINGSTSCAIPMLNPVQIIVNPLPIQQSLLGGGSYCEGSPAPEIFLASSQQGIQYGLFKNGITTGQVLTGTGFTLSFGQVPATGFYTVAASNTTTSCSTQINGNAQVIQYIVPQVFAGADQSIEQGQTAPLTAQVTGNSQYAFQWQPAAFVQQNQQANTATIPLYQSKLFTVTAKDLISQCVSSADSVKVIVVGGPLEVTLISDVNAICPGNSATIITNASGGSGNYFYTWTSTPAGFNSTESEITVQPQVTTTYNLSINDGNTTISKSLTITVYPLSQSFTVTGGGNYCNGDQGLTINLSGSQTGYQYSLVRVNQTILTKQGTGNPINFGIFTEPGSYSVTGENVTGGCIKQMTGTAVITSNEKPLANAGPEQLIQNGQTALLSGSATGGSGNYLFSWTPVNYLINPNAANAATVPLTTTRQFQLAVTDQVSGCQSLAAQTVVFVSGAPLLQIDATASSYNICPNEEVGLLALASGGSGNYTFAWQSTPAGFNSSIFNPTVTPSITTTYKITVSDGFLSATDSVTITVRPVPQKFQLQGGGSYCAGGQGPEIHLADSEPAVFYSLLKNGAETTILRQGTGDPLNFGSQTDQGTYQVKAFSPIHLCSATMTGQVDVLSVPRPMADGGPDVTIAYNGTTLLSASITGGSGNYSGKWQPESLVAQPNALLTNTLPLTSTTNFNFVATDLQSGCVSDPDIKTVFVSGTILNVQIEANSSQICAGSELQLNAVATGGTGSYSYYWTSEPSGFFGNSAQVTVSPVATTTFHVAVSDGLQTINKSFLLTVNTLPQLFVVTGGGNICNSGSKLPIGLSGSETGVLYSLYYEGTEIANLVGSGAALSFGLYNANGTYLVKAKKFTTSCEQTMQGNAVITSIGQVIADAGPDKNIYTGEQVILEGSVTSQGSNYTFSWEPSSMLMNPNAIQPTTISLQETTLFKLVASGQSGGCQPSEDFVTIFVEGTPIEVNLTASSEVICPGEPVQLIALPSGGNGNYTYSWESVPPGSVSTVFNPVFSPLVPTTYTVTVSDGSLIVFESIFINVKTLPTVFNLTGGGVFCPNETPPALVLSGSEIETNYVLFRNNTSTSFSLTGNGQPLVFEGITQGGSYTVQATKLSGCSQWMNGTAVITSSAAPVVVSSADQVIPAGSVALLNAVAGGGSGNYSYQWLPAAFVVNPQSASTATVALNQSTVFTVQATELQSGCLSNVDSSLVIVSGSVINVSILAQSSSVCYGSLFQLTALPEGGTGTYSFIWKDPNGLVIGTNAALSAPALISGSYSVTVTDGTVAASDAIDISILSVPTSFQISGGGFLCAGGAGLTIDVSDSETGIEYSLLLNNDQVVAVLYGTGNPLVFNGLMQAGTYSVRAKHLNSSCSITLNGSVELFPTEPISLVMPDLQTVATGQPAQLSAQVSGGSGNFLFSWEPAALVVNPQSLSTPTLPLSQSTAFILTVTDGVTGCEKAVQSFVIVTNSTLSLEIYAEETEICPGEGVRLFALASGGQGPITYSWTSVPSGFQSTVYNPLVNPIVTTIYTVIISDGTFTQNSSIQISVKPIAQAYEVAGGGNLCGNNTSVEITLSGSQPNADYYLLRNMIPTGYIIAGNGQPIQFDQITNAGEFTVSAYLQTSGCSSIMNGSALVDQYNSPISNAGADQSIATGNAAQLVGSVSDGSGFYAYQWNPSFLVQLPNASSTLTLPLTQSTAFLFYANDQQSGCVSGIDTTLVVVTGGPLNLQIFPDPAQACSGSSLVLTALPGGGSGSYSFQWTDASGQILGQNQQLTYVVANSGYIYVTINDGSFSLTDSTFIEAIALPQMFTVTGGGSSCNASNGVTIGLDGSEAGILYTLYKDFNQTIITVVGQGIAINFGSFSQQGVYTVIAKQPTQSCEVQMQGSALIQYFEAPVIEAGVDQIIPNGTSTQLFSTAYGGSGSYIYFWQPSDELMNPNAANPITKELFSSKVFTVQVTDVESGCTYEDQTIVFVSGSVLTINDIVLSDLSVCPGETVSCNVLPSGGSGIYTWSWVTSPGNEAGNSSAFSFQPWVTTQIKVSVSDGLSTVSDSTIVQIYPVPDSYLIGGGGSWCAGGQSPSIILSGSQLNVDYELFRNGISTGQIITGTGNPINFSEIQADGTYTIMASNTNGCITIMQGSAQLTQYQPPQQFSLSGGGSWCENDPSAGFLLSGSTIGTDYFLFLNDTELAGSYTGTGLPISISPPNVSGRYTVQAIHSGTSCSAMMSGTSNLLIYPLPQPVITGDGAICKGETIRLVASGGDTYQWLTTPQVFTNYLDVNPNESTVYELIATNSFGCENLTSHEVIVNSEPSFTLTDYPEQQIIEIQPEEFYPMYSFYSDGQLLSTGTAMAYFYGSTILPSDTVLVIATNAFGCESTREIVINGLSEEIIINAFSPNSDNINDRFLKGNFIKIYNRWGVEMYSGFEGWDGRYNGATVSPGTYYYLLELRDLNGNVLRTEKGSVTIVIE